MKRYGLVVSLALLFAAFMWSCQQQDPAPLSPEGSITLGKKPVAAAYTIKVFFENPEPTVPGDFILVAEEGDAVANRQGTAVSVSGNAELILIKFMDYFLASGECFAKLGVETKTMFLGDLFVIERDDPYDALGVFETDHKVEPSLRVSMWGWIEAGEAGEAGGVWLLPTTTGEPLVVTGNRLGIRVETGKRKTKDVCKQKIDPQPWRIEITLNT